MVKTIQTKDKVHTISLPNLKKQESMPCWSLQKAIPIYNPSIHEPLFRIKTAVGWQVMIDSRIRKMNVLMGLPRNYCTFNSFRHLGVTLAYNSHVHIKDTKQLGSWMSDCIWMYTQSDQNSADSIAHALTKVVDVKHFA